MPHPLPTKANSGHLLLIELLKTTGPGPICGFYARAKWEFALSEAAGVKFSLPGGGGEQLGAATGD